MAIVRRLTNKYTIGVAIVVLLVSVSLSCHI